MSIVRVGILLAGDSGEWTILGISRCLAGNDWQLDWLQARSGP